MKFEIKHQFIELAAVSFPNTKCDESGTQAHEFKKVCVLNLIALGKVKISDAQFLNIKMNFQLTYLKFSPQSLFLI